MDGYLFRATFSGGPSTFGLNGKAPEGPNKIDEKKNLEPESPKK